MEYFKNTATIHTPKRSRSSPSFERQQHNIMNLELMKQAMSELFDEKMINLATKKDIEDVKKQLTENKNEIVKLRSENAELKAEVEQIKAARDVDRRKLAAVEGQFKKKNIVIRGLKADLNITDAVKLVYNENLNIPDPLPITSARKLSERDGKMSVIVEMSSALHAEEVLKRGKMLAGTQISLEKDLDMIKLEQKKVMLLLKKQILNIDKTHSVRVVNEKLKIGEKWFYWNEQNELTCNKQNANKELRTLYGRRSEKINLMYENFVKQLEQK